MIVIPRCRSAFVKRIQNTQTILISHYLAYLQFTANKKECCSLIVIPFSIFCHYLYCIKKKENILLLSLY